MALNPLAVGWRIVEEALEAVIEHPKYPIKV
jgi:hypothetical protein